MLKKIYDKGKKKFVNTGVLKNLTFRAAPGFKFFLHRSLKVKGFSVTEESSGCCVIAAAKSKTAAINGARSLLQFQGVERLKQAITKAVEVQRNDKARV